MMRLALLITALVAVAAAVPAGAQTPAPKPHGALVHKAKPLTFSNPRNPKYNPGIRTGRDCISGRGANAGQQTVDPVTGKPRAATIVSIPIGNGGGNVASATTKAQQAQACGHTR